MDVKKKEKKLIQLKDKPFKCVGGEGKMIEWKEKGEKRHIKIFDGEDNDVLLMFERKGKTIPVRLSKLAVGGLLRLFLERNKVC